jgi:hypothetical protein
MIDGGSRPIGETAQGRRGAKWLIQPAIAGIGAAVVGDKGRRTEQRVFPRCFSVNCAGRPDPRFVCVRFLATVNWHEAIKSAALPRSQNS